MLLAAQTLTAQVCRSAIDLVLTSHSVPRAPDDHRSPERFNQYSDWHPSERDWGDPRVESFIRPAHFKPTTHRKLHVESMEYIFNNPPYIPVPPVETALLVDLDHPIHDLIDEKTGTLKGVLTRLRNEVCACVMSNPHC